MNFSFIFESIFLLERLKWWSIIKGERRRNNIMRKFECLLDIDPIDFWANFDPGSFYFAIVFKKFFFAYWAKVEC